MEPLRPWVASVRYPCIDRKLKPALVYAIRVPRFALPSLPNPSEVNPSGFSAPYIICSSSLFHRPRPPTDLPPTQPSTRRLRASFLSDSFALWCLDLICFSRPPVSLSLFDFIRASSRSLLHAPLTHPLLRARSGVPVAAFPDCLLGLYAQLPTRLHRSYLSTVIEGAGSNRPFKRLYTSLS